MKPWEKKRHDRRQPLRDKREKENGMALAKFNEMEKAKALMTEDEKESSRIRDKAYWTRFIDECHRED